MKYIESKDSSSEPVVTTFKEYNALAKAIKADKEWFERMIELCRQYYSTRPAGGNLHIVLDDGNLEDNNLAWCAGLCCGQNDQQGEDIANLMQLMTKKQRWKIYASYRLYRWHPKN